MSTCRSQKIRTSPYQPKTNGQCVCFNGTLLNMLGTLPHEQKKDWKAYVPSLADAYSCTKSAATGYGPYYLLYGRKTRFPIDTEFGLQIGGQKLQSNKFPYM